MTPEHIKAHLEATGWEEGHHGTYTTEMQIRSPAGISTRRVRVKFNQLTIRVDVHSSVGSNWIRIAGCSYDAVRKEPDGRLAILGFHLPGVKR